MSILTVCMLEPTTVHTTFFSLVTFPGITRTQFTLTVHNPIVNTKYIPSIYTFINTYIPTVLQTKCYNENSLPFKDEVRATEIGHLFEHLVLDSLCQRKFYIYKKSTIFNGLTEWDWRKEPWGVFHITIDIGKTEEKLLSLALEKSIELLTKLYETCKKDQSLITSNGYAVIQNPS